MRNVFSLLCAREKYYYSIRKCQMLHSSTSEYRTQYATALRGVPTPQRVEALRYTVPLGNLPNLLVLMSVPRAVFVCTLRPAIEELSRPLIPYADARGRFTVVAGSSTSGCSCPASSSCSRLPSARSEAPGLQEARRTSLMAAASTAQLSWVSAAMQSRPSIGM